MSWWSEARKWLPFERFQNPRPVVAVVRLAGVISSGGMALRRAGLNAQSVGPVLERAFKIGDVKTVALVINSPGGSPVQSSLIAKRVRALAEEHDVPVVAFAEDVAASGGYWLACAGDEIFVDESSIVGSIGVVAAGFGFKELIGRYGIERRVYTAGERKNVLDPFVEEKADEVERLRVLQGEIHDAFKALVRERRAGKLKAPEDELFTGEFWAGARAVELGLADGVDDLHSVMRDRFGEKVRLVRVGGRRGWLGQRFGVSILDVVMQAVEERLLWARFGL